MYEHDSRQIAFHDEPFLFGGLPLNSDNRWVKLAGVIPWSRVEEAYRKNFRGNRGARAKSVRLALGCLIVKEQLQLSDCETVQMIREHPYIQYFLGYAEYRYDISLDPSLLTYFRKRFPADVVAQVNQWVVDAARLQESEEENDDEEGGHGGNVPDEPSVDSVPESENHGTLILDASCAPQDIQYPTDTRLLHESRQKLEEMMDTLQAGREERKPRNYRQRANKEYKRFSRNRRPTRKEIRTVLRRQLQYVSRDLRLVAEMQQDSTVVLSDRQRRDLEIVTRVYEQQRSMYASRTHGCADRIVSLHQPYVRPIVRGKATAKTEFGAKLTVSLVDGYAEVTTLSWDAYNESQDLIKATEAYKERYGHYPHRILADKIFRTRHNRRYCQARGIHLNGPPLGRPPKDRTIYDKQLRLEREDSRERNAIEGKFGEGKRRYSLGLVKTRLQETSETQIHLAFLVMNLQKILRDLFIFFFSTRFFAKRRLILVATVG
jgi:IS5 family transposase